jgi:hypothetical protein
MRFWLIDEKLRLYTASPRGKQGTLARVRLDPRPLSHLGRAGIVPAIRYGGWRRLGLAIQGHP